MGSRFRLAALVVSVAFLACAILVDRSHRGDAVWSLIHPAEAAQLQRGAADHARALAYAGRLREDAARWDAQGDYVNAYDRLIAAAKWDPAGDRSPPVEQMRNELYAKLQAQVEAEMIPIRVQDAPAPGVAPSSPGPGPGASPTSPGSKDPERRL
jgi:hypothetical protein